MFGKFPNIEAFLEEYVKSQVKETMDLVHKLPIDEQVAMLSAVQVRNVAEIKASVNKRLPDDTSAPRHYQLIIIVNSIVSFSPEIKEDILATKQDKLPVFVAIRFGDRMGINETIDTGMMKGNKLHVKGEWITREKAYSHGGEKTSVLHFTHHPLGFTCTKEKCYS